MDFYNGITHVWHNSNTWSNNLIESSVFSGNILVKNIGTNLQFVVCARPDQTLVLDLFFDKSNTFTNFCTAFFMFIVFFRGDKAV